jgi:hypothetical protein
LLIKTVLKSVVIYSAFYNLEVLTCIRQLEVIATEEAVTALSAFKGCFVMVAHVQSDQQS